MLSDTITIIMPNTYISSPSAAHPTSLSWTHESCDTPDQNETKSGLVVPHRTLSGIMDRDLCKAVQFNTLLRIFYVFFVCVCVNIYYVYIYIYSIWQTQLSRATYRNIISKYNEYNEQQFLFH